MKITTWNVNGIRSLKKSIDSVLNELSTDIACLQETKVSRSQIPETTALVDGYTSYFSYPRKQSGYSGVGTYCSDNFVPEDAEEGLSASLQSRSDIQAANALACWELSTDDVAGFDSEGRVITTYHLIKYQDHIQRLAIINVYCPRVDPEKLERHVYKMRFCLLLEAKVRELSEKGCSVIILGDMNIAHSVIDHCDPGDEQRFNSSEARQWLRAFLSSEIRFCDESIGVVDAFRHFHPDKKEAYTCWNTKTGARLTNYGTRIDYILLSSDLLGILQSCEILSDYHGSDHCPVKAVFKCDAIPEKNVQLPAICTRLWPEFSGQQQKLKAFFQRTQDIADRVTKHEDVATQPSYSRVKTVVKKKKQKSITNFFTAPSTVEHSNHSVPYISNGLASKESEQSDRTSETSSLDFNIQSFNGETSVISKLENSSSDNECSKMGSSVKNNQSSAWKTMLSGPPKPPLCSGHQKECVLRTVKKKGPNYGRNFFICAYPGGHSSNPDASCNFFKWINAPKANVLKKCNIDRC